MKLEKGWSVMMRKRPNRPIDRTLFQAGKEESLNAGALDTPERVLAYCQDQGLIDGNATNIQGLIEGNPELSLDFENIGEYDAYIEKTDEKHYRIVINSKHSPTRQRFSMTHEYVHYQVHRQEIKNMPRGERILHRSEERNRIEYQANNYAAEILMPELAFLQISRAKNGDISEIAKEFRVSPLAVRYRARTLGIAGHGL